MKGPAEKGKEWSAGFVCPKSDWERKSEEMKGKEGWVVLGQQVLWAFARARLNWIVLKCRQATSASMSRISAC